MKTNLLLIAMLTLGFSTFQVQAQTTVYAKNSDISDNLDLRAVASIFGESNNLQDFERRLNDPKYQISNLDLNDDNDVDYLRVIESVENRTHVVIIQAVLDRDVYQDIATIDVERDNYNKVSVQVVGNSYLYGDNYIYEPVYHVSPVIYTSFWVNNYRPYYSSCTWNVYPTYYYAWRPYPIYRYRRNINVCINVSNNYNYVNYRRSYRAPAICETRRAYGYEKMRPNHSFSQRNSNVNNRYELDQRRVASRESSRSNGVYTNANRSNEGRSSSLDNKNRNYTENRGSSNKNYNTERVAYNRDNTVKAATPARVESTRRPESQRSYGENNMSSSRGSSESRNNSNRVATEQRAAEPQRNYSQNRSNSENRNSTSRPQATQRSEAPRANQEARGNQGSRESSSSSRSGGRRI
ncbi:hypothetical protein [Flavobacterium geliluteum]|uniref:DUF3300 domain-containing protein n=1 Tax=Flavobacterium geliluteum TaxID=2816120 RepID=A0A940X8D0_9FLAO|nr:hypothetical protein [Flavobacterium geliluteum]MBP4138345.1 hypothetical protein [Flavobacterium geliluteum]